MNLFRRMFGRGSRSATPSLDTGPGVSATPYEAHGTAMNTVTPTVVSAGMLTVGVQNPYSPEVVTTPHLPKEVNDA